MYFVGRERETARVVRALDQGKNVVVTGKYGVGRTSLIRHVAELTQEGWRFLFADFSQTLGRMCHDLLAKLTPGKNLKDYPACAKYKVARSFIVNMEFGDKKQPVIVLDNVGKLSQQKLAFIRYLAREKRFLLIALGI